MNPAQTLRRVVSDRKVDGADDAITVATTTSLATGFFGIILMSAVFLDPNTGVVERSVGMVAGLLALIALEIWVWGLCIAVVVREES